MQKLMSEYFVLGLLNETTKDSNMRDGIREFFAEKQE
jgi:hypothetical protein